MSGAQPRIDENVSDVGKQIEHDVYSRRDEHDALHDRVIWLKTASMINLPKPGMVKICSVRTAPERSVPNSIAPSVMTGVSALRMACLKMTVRSYKPFARAVRT